MASALLIILIVASLGMVTFRYLQLAMFYPIPGRMPPNVDEDVAAALHRFETVLLDRAPEMIKSLQPGLSDDQIATIESNHRLRLTDDLRALYRWRNGSPTDSTYELVPGHRFMPLEEAAQTRDGIRLQVASATLIQRVAFAIFAGHRRGWLTVLDDRAGDGYFYDPGRRRDGGSFFYHFAEDRQYRFFPSLANFLIGCAECYEEGIYRFRARGHASEDFERAFELWPRYSVWSR